MLRLPLANRAVVVMAVKADDPEYLAAHLPDEGRPAVYELRQGTEELDYLLAVVCDPNMDVSTRLKAADKLAPYRHAKKGDPMPVVLFDAVGWLREVRAMTGGGLSVIDQEPNQTILGNPGPRAGGA